jgi:hypothetical protein
MNLIVLDNQFPYDSFLFVQRLCKIISCRDQRFTLGTDIVSKRDGIGDEPLGVLGITTISVRIDIVEELKIKPCFFELGNGSSVGLPLGIIYLLDDDLFAEFLLKDFGDVARCLPFDDNFQVLAYQICEHLNERIGEGKPTDPFVGVLECEERPFANIRGGDDGDRSISLERNVDQNIACLVTLEDKEEWTAEILNEERSIQTRGLIGIRLCFNSLEYLHIRSAGNTLFLEVVVDAGLGVKVRHTRVIKCDPDKVFYTSLFSSIHEALALVLFFEEARPDYEKRKIYRQ